MFTLTTLLHNRTQVCALRPVCGCGCVCFICMFSFICLFVFSYICIYIYILCVCVYYINVYNDHSPLYQIAGVSAASRAPTELGSGSGGVKLRQNNRHFTTP